ncbi:unnamed protein product [Ceutorhynchus assimilis]|uniref:Jumonji domain-containing protein 4 n=1 Tax=Ceutorhynchus assimilis TaxID=467358 RepID=A0A9N9MTG5_9CUCU|nr:unnamed protein product [Ceutorhynchus assimilis]
MEFDVDPTNSNQTTTNYDQIINISTIDSNNFSYGDFFANYMQKNVPCIIKNVSNDWQSTHKWVTNGQPNIDHLMANYQDTKVVIYKCSERYFNSQKCTEATLAQYLKDWPETNDFYLKDWHLKLQRKNDQFYEVPIYFASDWLNEYFVECQEDDYRFVYMGQKGTWTPLHSDVFGSFSWSVNVCGQKKWLFFPPGEENYLKDSNNILPYDIAEINHSRKCFEVLQNPGEAIFVPSGWYHQVWNMEDTISINHNWVNGCNINLMWQNMKENLNRIKEEIKDCKTMDGFNAHCQLMLKSLFGLNFQGFFDFLVFICKKRLAMMQGEASKVLFHGHSIGTNHIVFDLMQISKVLKDFLGCDDVISSTNFNSGNCLLQEIVQILGNKDFAF